MYFFLDSNIFHNNWFLTQANFNYLFNYISNTKSLMLVSELVCEEVENNRQRGIDEVILTMTQQLDKAKKLNRNHVEYDFTTLNQPYNLKSLLEEVPGDKKYLPYNQVEQTKVVKRALKRTRPFQDGEKGYRDTLIWLSLLDFLKKAGATEDVVFINNNSSDFYNKSTSKFHDDLKKDIDEHQLKCKFIIFDSLYKFISTQIDTSKHRIAYPEMNYQYLQPLEDLFEFETASLLNSQKSSDFLAFIRTSNHKFPYISHLLDHEFEYDEGMEDPKVINHHDINTNEIYVRYNFNLRRCTIMLTIPIEDYQIHKIDIERYYDEVTIVDDEVVLVFFVRAYFETTFTYLIQEQNFKGLSLETISLERH